MSSWFYVTVVELRGADAGWRRCRLLVPRSQGGARGRRTLDFV